MAKLKKRQAEQPKYVETCVSDVYYPTRYPLSLIARYQDQVKELGLWDEPQDREAELEERSHKAEQLVLWLFANFFCDETGEQFENVATVDELYECLTQPEVLAVMDEASDIFFGFRALQKKIDSPPSAKSDSSKRTSTTKDTA